MAGADAATVPVAGVPGGRVPVVGVQGIQQGVVAASALRERLDVPGGRPPFPVAEPLGPLLPSGGLRRGSVIAVSGSTALLLALLAAATAQGAWAAVVGIADLGVLAAIEAGVAVQRLALIPRPGPDPASAIAALLDGMGLVALAGADRVPAGTRRALAARVRQRGAVLLPFGPWPGADIELRCRAEIWHGAEQGAGRLRSREVVVHAIGRGAAARPRTARLLLPGPDGSVAPVLMLDPASGSSAARTIKAVG
jgi:hypothetical protein